VSKVLVRFCNHPYYYYLTNRHRRHLLVPLVMAQALALVQAQALVLVQVQAQVQVY
jgi:hypothetical protein